MITIDGLRIWACGAAVICWMFTMFFFSMIEGIFDAVGSLYFVLMFGLLVRPVAAHYLRLFYIRFLHWRMKLVVFEIIVLCLLSGLSAWLANFLKGKYAIISLCFALGFITFAEIAVIDHRDFGLADMIQGNLIGILSGMLGSPAEIIIFVSSACYARKLLVSWLEENSPEAATKVVLLIQGELTVAKSNCSDLKAQLEQLLPHHDWEANASFVAINNSLDKITNNVQKLGGN